MQAFLLILMTCAVALIFVDIFKRGTSVKRAFVLAIMSLIICVLSYRLEIGNWVLWLICTGIWVFLVVLRSYVSQIKREAEKIKEIRERWKMPEGDFHPWIPTRPKEDE